MIRSSFGVGSIPFPFGKHRGERLDEIPEDFLLWAVDLPDIRPSLREAIRRQLGLDDDGYHGSAAQVLPGIIWRWREYMREEYGDTDRDAVIITAGFDALKQLCEELTGQKWPDRLPPLPPPPPPRAVAAGSRPWGML